MPRGDALDSFLEEIFPGQAAKEEAGNQALAEMMSGEYFQAAPPSRKKEILGQFFDDSFLSKTGPQYYDKATLRAQRHAFVSANMPDTRPDRPGWGGAAKDVLAAAISGPVQGVETTLRGLQAVSGESGGQEGESFLDRAVEGVSDFQADRSWLQTSKQARSGKRRWATEAISSVSQSLTVQAPATVLGAVAGSFISPGAGTVTGGIAGYTLSGGTMFGLAEYDRFMEEAHKAGIEKGLASGAALQSAIAEGGFEFVTDLLEMVTAGVAKPLTRPAKAGLKKGVEALLAPGWKRIAGGIARTAAVETTGEGLTAGVQAETAHQVGMGDERFWGALKQAMGPSAVAGVIFGGMGARVSAQERRNIKALLLSPDAPAKSRLQAVGQVEKTIAEANPLLARVWRRNADEAVKAGKSIPIDEDIGWSLETPGKGSMALYPVAQVSQGDSLVSGGASEGVAAYEPEKAREIFKKAMVDAGEEGVGDLLKGMLESPGVDASAGALPSAGGAASQTGQAGGYARDRAAKELASDKETEQKVSAIADQVGQIIREQQAAALEAGDYAAILSPGQKVIIESDVEDAGGWPGVLEQFAGVEPTDAYARQVAEGMYGPMPTVEATAGAVAPEQPYMEEMEPEAADGVPPQDSLPGTMEEPQDVVAEPSGDEALYARAVELVRETGKASPSMLVSQLGVSWQAAGDMVARMEADLALPQAQDVVDSEASASPDVVAAPGFESPDMEEPATQNPAALPIKPEAGPAPAKPKPNLAMQPVTGAGPAAKKKKAEKADKIPAADELKAPDAGKAKFDRLFEAYQRGSIVVDGVESPELAYILDNDGPQTIFFNTAEQLRDYFEGEGTDEVRADLEAFKSARAASGEKEAEPASSEKKAAKSKASLAMLPVVPGKKNNGKKPELDASSVTAAKPETNAAKSETNAAKPETNAAKPETNAAKPETKEAKPETKEAKPETKEAKPETKEAKPETKEAKPNRALEPLTGRGRVQEPPAPVADSAKVETLPGGDRTVSVPMATEQAEELSGKEQKAYLLAEIAKAKKTAEKPSPATVDIVFSRKQPGTGDDTGKSDFRPVPNTKHSLQMAKDVGGDVKDSVTEKAPDYGTVEFVVPGDGRFILSNDLVSLERFEKFARAMPFGSTPPRDVAAKTPLSKPSGKRPRGADGPAVHKYYRQPYSVQKEGIIAKPNGQNFIGDGFFSDGNYTIRTNEKPQLKSGGKLIKLEPGQLSTVIPEKYETEPVRFVGEALIEGNVEPVVHAVSSTGRHVFYVAKYADSILTAYPDAKAEVAPGVRYALVFTLKGHAVGSVMPLRGEYRSYNLPDDISGPYFDMSGEKRLPEPTDEQARDIAARATEATGKLYDVYLAAETESQTAANAERIRKAKAAYDLAYAKAYYEAEQEILGGKAGKSPAAVNNAKAEKALKEQAAQKADAAQRAWDERNRLQAIEDDTEERLNAAGEDAASDKDFKEALRLRQDADKKYYKAVGEARQAADAAGVKYEPPGMAGAAKRMKKDVKEKGETVKALDVDEVAAGKPQDVGAATVEPGAQKEKIAQKFGEHIGGSRWDRHRDRLSLAQYAGMEEREKEAYAKKEFIFRGMDYVAMVGEGVPAHVAFVLKKVKDSLPVAPPTPALRDVYVAEMNRVRDVLANVKSEGDLDGFFYKIFTPEYFDTKQMGYARWTEKGKEAARALGGNKLVKAAQPSRYTIEAAQRNVSHTGWPEPAKNSKQKNGEKYKPPKRPLLDYVTRTGKDYRGGRDVSSDEFMKAFGFRGGEFGVWLSQSDRQESLNHAYDGLMDLASILNVPPTALSLNGELGFAFGARGHGHYAAHYEPVHVVINLTKLSGAGAMAHEWAHALDDYLGRSSSREERGKAEDRGKFASEGKRRGLRPELVEAFNDVMFAIKNREWTKEETVGFAEKRKASAQGFVRERLDAIKGRIGTASMTHADRDAWENMTQGVISGRLKPEMIGGRTMPGSGKVTGGRQGIGEFFDLHKKITGKLPSPYDSENLYYLALDIASADRAIAEADTKKPSSHTEFLTDAHKIDRLKGGKRYWSTDVELFARAFEAYAEDKVAEGGEKSQYLVHGTTGKADAAPYAYPMGAERQSIDEAFGRLFAEIQTRETDKGTELYSTGAFDGGEFTPWADVAVEDVQGFFPEHAGWSVERTADGAVFVKNADGAGFLVEAVDDVGADDLSFRASYGRDQEAGEIIKGKYERGRITISRKAGGKWTFAHEAEHFLEDLGFFAKGEIEALGATIRGLHGKGKLPFKSAFDKAKGKDKALLGGKEDRARFVEEALRKRDFDRGTFVGQVLQRLADWADGFVNLVKKTGRGVIRDLERGRIQARRPRVAEMARRAEYAAAAAKARLGMLTDTEAAAKPPIRIVRVKVPEGANSAESLRDVVRGVAKGFRDIETENWDTGWKILIPWSGIKHASTGGGDQLLSVTAIPGILRHAVWERSEVAKSMQEGPTHIFYAGVLVEGKLYRARIVVREIGGGEKYYDHALSGIEGAVAVPGSYEGKPSTAHPAAHAAPSYINVNDLLAGVKGRDEKSLSTNAWMLTKALDAELERHSIKDITAKLVVDVLGNNGAFSAVLQLKGIPPLGDEARRVFAGNLKTILRQVSAGKASAEFSTGPVTGPAVTRDFEQNLDFANGLFRRKDLGVQMSRTDVAKYQKRLQQLAGSRKFLGKKVVGFDEWKRSAESDQLDMALLVWRDVKGDLKKIEGYRRWAKLQMALPDVPRRDKVRMKRHLEILDRVDGLTDEEKAFAEEIGERFDRAFEIARANKVIQSFVDGYVRRIWRFPDSQKEGVEWTGSGHGFKVYTTAAKQRKLDTIFDGWRAGYELSVQGLTNSWGTYNEELETILANKDFVLQGYNTRDANGNRLFDTKYRAGYVELKAPGFSVWKWTGQTKSLGVPPDTESALIVKDYGKHYFMAPVRREPEKWAVYRAKDAPRPSRVFATQKMADEWLALNGEADGYVQHRAAHEVSEHWEKRTLYAPAELAGMINKMTAADSLFRNTPAASWLARFNSSLKSWILLSSFFHHMAGTRSWALAVHHGWKAGKAMTDPVTGLVYKSSGVNPVTAYKNGYQKVLDNDPLLMLGVKNGLTLGEISDWNENALRSMPGIMESLAESAGFERAVKVIQGIKRRRENFETSLFGRYFAGLKAEAFIHEYIYNLQQAHDAHVAGTGPAPNTQRIAEITARVINEDFGGLHLGRMGRNPTWQKAARLLLLAPDWTESNFRMVTGLVPGLNEKIAKAIGDIPPPAGMPARYKEFFAKVLTRTVVMTMVAQLLLNGWEDTWEFWEEQTGNWTNFKRFRWAGVDVTKIYALLGQETLDDERKVFSIGGHFMDPVKLIDPIRLMINKGSPATKIAGDLITGRDYAGRPFTGVGEFLATGKTIGTSYHQPTKGFFNRLPSNVFNTTLAMQPIQFQAALQFFRGEEDALTALLQAGGIHMQKTFAAPETMAVRTENETVKGEMDRLTEAGAFSLGAPGRNYARHGMPMKLTNAQYKVYVEESAKIAGPRLEKLMSGPGWGRLNDEQKGRVLVKIIKRARKRAKVKALAVKEVKEAA